MALARAAQPHPLGNLCCASARRQLGGVSSGAARCDQAAAVGAGEDGHPRERASLSAGPSGIQPRSRRGARRARRTVGDGRGCKMRRSFRRRWRIVGRPENAQLHRDAAIGSCIGTQRNTMLAGTIWRNCEPQRRSDALAHRKLGFARQRSRPARPGIVRVECRAVPRPRIVARPLEPRS